ncbi:hypothetical protein TNCV_4623511 [Trichonephila clavipes]|nr:hypothetical protein TNCV_4623511 [Trichonephila clavipes]
MIRYQTDKLAEECVEGTEKIRNQIGMQGRKCHSCELWCSKVHVLLLLGSHKEFGMRDFCFFLIERIARIFVAAKRIHDMQEIFQKLSPLDLKRTRIEFLKRNIFFFIPVTGPTLEVDIFKTRSWQISTQQKKHPCQISSLSVS